ncbi:hypothetical protein JTB14_035133 [Gonioctena quinquepunctata]|nr:hypothetical protein JTB14_035133 [Gonioctena quinquepunctata]
MNRDFLIHFSKQLVEAEGMNNPLEDNVSGRKWFEGFLKRHPRVGQKKAEYICKARAVVNGSGIRSWFSHVAEQLGENIEKLKDPRRVFDMDETAIHLAPKGGLVLAERGKSVHDVAAFLSKLINDENFVNVIKSGFEACGICPVDADAVIDNSLEARLMLMFYNDSSMRKPQAIEDDTNADNDQQSPSCLPLTSEDLNLSITNDDNIMEFEFPEFSELNFDEVIEPDAVSTLSTENVSNSNTMTMRRKASDGVINQIVMWPEKQPSKRKRAVEHLPSVITSGKMERSYGS